MRTSFVDAPDGTRLRLGAWGDGTRDLLVVPGLAEHAGRYGHVAEALVGRGWTVHVLELRGHGHSGGRRGHVNRWGDYVSDVRAAAAALRPGWSLLAHSMGGLVSLDAIREGGLSPARLALSNPLLGVRVQAPLVKKLAGRVLSRLWPTLSLGNELDPEQLSRDAAVVKAYREDPLVYGTITPRWYTEMLAAIQRVGGHRYALPMGMFVGDADTITDPDANRAFAERHGAHLKVYAGWRHEIFNELGREEAIGDVASWLAG